MDPGLAKGGVVFLFDIIFAALSGTLQPSIDLLFAILDWLAYWLGFA